MRGAVKIIEVLTDGDDERAVWVNLAAGSSDTILGVVSCPTKLVSPDPSRFGSRCSLSTGVSLSGYRDSREGSDSKRDEAEHLWCRRGD